MHEQNGGFTNAAYRQFLNERKLMAARCAACGALYLPPRPICSACHGSEMVWYETSGQGKLTAFTIVHIAPTAMLEAGYGRENPYCAGIVQLCEGPAISAQILGVDAARPEQIKIGVPLSATFIERGATGERYLDLAFQVG